MPSPTAVSTSIRASWSNGAQATGHIKSGSKAAIARRIRVVIHQALYRSGSFMTASWPPGVPLSTWLVIAGLGAFHGINPAMGWLFAVALGLHRRSRQAVLLALPPIAPGHAVSIAILASPVFTLS